MQWEIEKDEKQKHQNKATKQNDKQKSQRSFSSTISFLKLVYFIRKQSKLGYRYDLKCIEIIRPNDAEAVHSPAEHENVLFITGTQGGFLESDLINNRI